MLATVQEKTELMVALDYARPESALELVQKLDAFDVIFKIGLELFTGCGPQIVRELIHRKKRVFLDLKLHDIPNTVAKAAHQAALMHVEFLTVHLQGGGAMIRAISDEFKEMPNLRPKILGVSVLTSFDDVKWAEVTKATTGHAVEVLGSVVGLVSQGLEWGVDGVVCSAMELPEIRKLNPSAWTVVPGIRLEGNAAHDQARVMTPAAARKAGASAIVMGRPITGAEDPVRVVEQVLSEICHSY